MEQMTSESRLQELILKYCLKRIFKLYSKSSFMEISHLEYMKTVLDASTFELVLSTFRLSKQLTPKPKRILQVVIAKYYSLKRKLMIYGTSKQISRLESLKRTVSASQYEFILSKFAASKFGDKHRCQWSAKDKVLAFNIFLKSPQIYSVLERHFEFPSLSNLRRSTERIANNDGFSPIVLKALLEKGKKMTPREKLCSLLFHEMPLKAHLSNSAVTDYIDNYVSCNRGNGPPELAPRAVVFMIKGLTQNWKQIIAYFFREHSAPVTWLKNILFEIITKVHECGFRVVATVCNQGPLNQALFKDLEVSVESPFFFCNESKIFTLYDMPHLLKSVGNSFKKYDIQFLQMKKASGEKKMMTASWAHLEEFYERDKEMRCRLSERLTAKHIYSKTLAVKDVKRVFSHKVATGLSFHATHLQMQSKCQQTAEFIFDMNELFDSLNSEKHKSRGLSAAVSKDSKHIEFWVESAECVKTWKFLASSGKIVKPACQKGLQMTLNAVIGIWREFKEDLVYLMTNRLNLGSLDDVFSSIKKHRGFKDNPDSFQFKNAIRCVIVPTFEKKPKIVVEEEDVVDVERNLLDICKTDVCMMMVFSEDDIATASLDCAILDDLPIPSISNSAW